MGRKTLCCTDNLLVLMVCGVFVSLMGLVLLIIYIVARGITSSLHLVEPPIPTYVAALLTITLGVISIILTKRRHLILICSSILLSVLDLIVCIVHAVTAGLVSIPFLGSFSVCVLRATSAECQCYILGEGNTNSSVIVPGDVTKHFTFEDVKSCGSIETALKDFLYTLCILYSFTSLGCIVTGTMCTMLLCGSRKADKGQGHQQSRTSSTRRVQETARIDDENHANQRRADAVTSPIVSSVRGREATTQVTPQGRRPPGSTAATPEGRPIRRSASATTPHSSSLTASAAVTASGSARPASAQRFNSVAGTNESARQRPRLPLLVRSGYLQSHVNGPRVPVYSVQGSHEAYIALTDLPKLQLPALDQVPAYVREPDFPSYEPPPYSPVPDTVSESPELAAEHSSSQPPAARQRLSFPEEVTAIEVHQVEHQTVVLLDPPEILPLPAARQELPTGHAAVPFETAGSSGDVQPDDQSDNGQPETFVTGDVIVHERDVESDHDSIELNDLDSESVNLEVARAGRNDSAIDFPPPDILMEAIESARSSMNVTAASIVDEDAHSSDQVESQGGLRSELLLSSPQNIHSSPVNNLGESRDSTSPYINLVHPRDVSSLYNDLERSREDFNQSSSFAVSRGHEDQSRSVRPDGRLRGNVKRSESARGTRQDLLRDSSNDRSSERIRGHLIIPENDHGDVITGNSSRSTSPKRKSLQRSKSMSSPIEGDREHLVQNRLSMPKDGRHAIGYERDNRATPSKRTSQSPHGSKERKREADRSLKKKDRARDKGSSSRAARRDMISQEQGTSGRVAVRDCAAQDQDISRVDSIRRDQSSSNQAATRDSRARDHSPSKSVSKDSKVQDRGTPNRAALRDSLAQDLSAPSRTSFSDSKARDRATSSRGAVRDSRAREHSNSRSAQRDSTSTDADNLSDIISLVERVHNTHAAERSSKRKKRKKSGRKEDMLSSKV